MEKEFGIDIVTCAAEVSRSTRLALPDRAC